MADSVRDLRKQSVADLRKRETELREEVARLQMKRYARRLDKTSELGDRKKDLARVLTVIAEMQRKAAQAQGAG